MSTQSSPPLELLVSREIVPAPVAPDEPFPPESANPLLETGVRQLWLGGPRVDRQPRRRQRRHEAVSAEALEGEHVLGRVRRYREAARMTVRAEASVRERCLALLEIADMARQESDLTIRTWAERAIWEESKAFLGMDDAEPGMSHRRPRRIA